MRATASSAFGRDRQPSSTRAPLPASTFAASKPSPVFAPVTRKVRPTWEGTSASVKFWTGLVTARLLRTAARVADASAPGPSESGDPHAHYGRGATRVKTRISHAYDGTNATAPTASTTSTGPITLSGAAAAAKVRSGGTT